MVLISTSLMDLHTQLVLLFMFWTHKNAEQWIKILSFVISLYFIIHKRLMLGIIWMQSSKFKSNCLKLLKSKWQHCEALINFIELQFQNAATHLQIVTIIWSRFSLLYFPSKTSIYIFWAPSSFIYFHYVPMLKMNINFLCSFDAIWLWETTAKALA